MLSLTRLIQTVLFALTFLKYPMGYAMELALDSIEDQRDAYIELETPEASLKESKIAHNLPLELYKHIHTYLQRPEKMRVGLVSKELRDRIRDKEYVNILKEKTTLFFQSITTNNYYSHLRFNTLSDITTRIQALADNAKLIEVRMAAQDTLKDNGIDACQYLGVCEGYLDYKLSMDINALQGAYNTFRENKISQSDFVYLAHIYNYTYAEKNSCTICCLNCTGNLMRAGCCCADCASECLGCAPKCLACCCCAPCLIWYFCIR